MESKKLIIGPVHADYAANGNLRALITAAALAMYEYDTDNLETVDLEVVRGRYDASMERWLAVRAAAIATDPLWRQTFSALSVGQVEFGRFEMERIRSALMWPRLFKELVDALCKEFGYDEAEVVLLYEESLTSEQSRSLYCGVTIRLDTALGYYSKKA